HLLGLDLPPPRHHRPRYHFHRHRTQHRRSSAHSSARPCHGKATSFSLRYGFLAPRLQDKCLRVQTHSRRVLLPVARRIELGWANLLKICFALAAGIPQVDV
ncbi:unnamed protein product, partial [Ectocarpus sp. 13 AM-2016]